LKLTLREGGGRFGFVGYYVDVPNDYPKERAARIVRNIRVHNRKLKLGHVKSRLLDIAGSRFSPRERAKAGREAPPWVRLLDR